MTRRIAETYAAGGVVVVGMGAGGWAGLGESARHALRQAATIIGSPRQLDELPVWLGARRQDWRSPRREDIRALIEEHADAGVAVLASGDPLLYGIGRTLVEELGIERLHFLPSLSSVALACARLGWPAETVTVVNAPLGGLDSLSAHLSDGARIIVLSAGRDTPATVATRLADQAYGDSHLVVLGDLGAAREGRWEGTASGWDAEVTSGLNVVAITCRGGSEAVRHSDPPSTHAPQAEATGPGRASTYGAARLADIGPFAPGQPGQPGGPGRTIAAAPQGGQSAQPDAGRGMLTTTASVVAISSVAVLTALDPAPGEVLWEVGGTGGAALAWSMAAPGARAAILTAYADPVDRVTPFGVVPVQRVEGTLPAAAAGLPTPDAVLLCDTSAAPGVMEATWRALRLGGRLLALATTIDEAAGVARYHRVLGGELTRIQLSAGVAKGDQSRYGPPTELVIWVRRKTPALGATRG